MKKRILGITLGMIVLLLAGILVWIQVASMPFKVIEKSKYDFYAYKVETTDNTITETTYSPKESPVIKIETYYLENGKLVKIVTESHYETISSANRDYSLDKFNGNINLYESYKIEKNVITKVSNNPNYGFYVDQTENFTTNKEYIDFYNLHIYDSHPNCVRVY